jgi:hypothetical protein
MKLKGFTNYKQIVASVARYDYITVGEGADYIMADGGQPNIGDSEPYSRFWGAKIWFEVPQTFAELYNDWRENFGEKRKYGVWNYNEVKILSPEEFPNIQSFEWKAENSIWGTLGINGDEPISFVMLKVTAVVAAASAIAALTPTPKDNNWVGKLYKIVDWLALNVGKAKDK